MDSAKHWGWASVVCKRKYALCEWLHILAQNYWSCAFEKNWFSNIRSQKRWKLHRVNRNKLNSTKLKI